MSAQEFNVSMPVLEWIAQSQGSSLQELADTLDFKKQDKFLQGIINKTQAETLTKLAKIPFGFLFLQKPPIIHKPKLPDFRNTVDSVPLTDNFYDTFVDIQQKLDWYEDYLIRNGLKEQLPFVGKFDYRTTSIETVADDIRQQLKLDTIAVHKISKEKYLKKIVENIELLGVLVFKNGIVINNTHRLLDVNEFRGFAIADIFTPAIFINGNDAESAQLFTLMHELAHIWVGQSGVSDWSYPFDNAIESYCNKVASNVLMPTETFITLWDSTIEDKLNLEALAQYFKSSELSVAIKAHQLNLVTSDMVTKIREQLTAFLQQEKARKSKDKNGGDYNNSVPLRNSKRLTQIIVRDTLNQHTLLRDASRLLHAKPNAIMTTLSKAV